MLTVLVTGVSSGIGLACVGRFHRAGWRVIGTVRNAADAARLQAAFPGITTLQIDLRDPVAIDTVIGGALREAQAIDVVINNAGASIIGAAEELALDDFRAQLELNLLAAVQIARLALPLMRARGSGRILQVSSGFGRIALPMFSAYCASKYALEGFSEALAHEVAPFGIRVSLIEPGTVRTRFDANRREAAGYDNDGPYQRLYRAMRTRLASSHARGPSSPDDVADVLFTAATCRQPRLRYRVGRLGIAADLAARFLPDTLKQVVIGRWLQR